MKYNAPFKTTIECTRCEFEQSYRRVDDFGNGLTSELYLEHRNIEKPNQIKEEQYLKIDASKFTGVLTNSMIVKSLQEMDSGLRTGRITSLKLIGLTDKNCEADLFRRQNENYLVDGSFSRLREVVFESGYTQEQINDENFQPSMLPSKPFPKAEIDFIKFDGQQYIPNNFLFTTYSVENIICPDNDNTHYFLNIAKNNGANVVEPEIYVSPNIQGNMEAEVVIPDAPQEQ